MSMVLTGVKVRAANERMLLNATVAAVISWSQDACTVVIDSEYDMLMSGMTDLDSTAYK